MKFNLFKPLLSNVIYQNNERQNRSYCGAHIQMAARLSDFNRMVEAFG